MQEKIPNPPAKSEIYDGVIRNIRLLIDGETDWVAAMATVTCELHNAFDRNDWTGFYRAIGDVLVIGPYQGSHGCLRIPFGRGVCGTAAAEKATQLVPDVELFPGHIACSSSTRSEIVVPVIRPNGSVFAVLDIDSDEEDAFDEVDQAYLEDLCAVLGRQFAEVA